MCGIAFTTHPDGIKKFHLIKNRGPSSTTIKSFEYQQYLVSMGVHLLSITGVKNGEQPFFKNDVYVLCNGEIYNHKELKEKYNLPCTTESDCEVILHLYLMHRSIRKLNKIRGEFAFIIFDMREGTITYARDFCGVRPLFIGIDSSKHLHLSSELKGLAVNGCQVQPGIYHIYRLVDNNEKKVSMSLPSETFIKDALISSVKDRINTEVPMGFLLSGGLDSSLILSIASRFIPKNEKIIVFTTGFSLDSPDVLNAKKAIEYLTQRFGDRYIHHIFIPTIEEGLEAIPEVIKAIESYDTATVRASTPMWLLARYIRKNTSVKVVLSGEGSDEINGSYLYFHYAPDKNSFENERKRLVKNIHYYDGIRADRTISAFGLELRVPFLDIRVVNSVLTSEDIYKSMRITKIEKYFLRVLFDEYLPPDLLLRTKEDFSDAVSYQWKDRIKSYADSLNIPDVAYSHISPTSPEEKWYRNIFEKYYPGQGLVIPELWLPKWVETNGEPSATILSVHQEKLDLESSPLPKHNSRNSF